ncbi:transcriptional regulator [Oceanisphaera sp. DM8]|uniref:Anti-sigma-E factor RseA n=2 Tax=Oceanisphaera pacifica TaxID=2818389 RepID=A0ABS3NIM7_9GAMM|nr:RseA family anti-sigma factor [Oceanisphaera pacifica]MBO1520140.1 transcriptional regulator [Oceanisphaera pacifica]
MANKEQISALVDGEIQDKVLLEQLSDDQELADTFGRYHLYGDALRNDLPQDIQLDVSDNIAMALASEPSLVSAPATQPPLADAAPVDMHAQAQSAKVVRPRFGKVSPMLRYIGQFAVAASVSAAVIVGVQQYSQQDLQSPVLNTIPLNGGAAPVSLNYQTQSPQQVSEQTRLEQQRRIHELLMDHELQQRLRHSER